MLIDTPSGAKASAVIYSIVETAKINNLKVYPYITYLLTELMNHKNIDDLLPCPKCKEVCPVYDYKATTESSWRANDINGVSVVLLYKPSRVEFSKHGVLTEYLP